ncbi:MAG: hypothetical protein KBD57_04325 [Bacteroidia bacterium]|nr:hypothetical protein [Bacteroidia bacterium]
MFLKRFFAIILLVVCCAATDDYHFVNSIPFSRLSFLTTDKLGNAYVIVGNQLLQFDKNGKPLANYSKNNFGELRSVDASNPMKLMLFYPDFAQIVILNTKLAEKSIIHLRASEINQPIVSCNSENGGYWIYDNDDDQLKKLDLNLQIQYQSGNLTQMIGYKVQPRFLLEEDGFVYMSDPENGIFVFDLFGTYYKLLPFKGLKTFQVIDQNILYVRENKLLRYDSKTAIEQEVLLPAHDSILNARIEAKELYLLTSDSLSFYSF